MSDEEVEDIDLQKKDSEPEEPEPAQEKQEDNSNSPKDKQEEININEDKSPQQKEEEKQQQQQDEEENEEQKMEAAEQFFKEQEQQQKQQSEPISMADQPAANPVESKAQQPLERKLTLSSLTEETSIELKKQKETLYFKLKGWFDQVQLHEQQHKIIFDLMWSHIKVICKQSLEETQNLMKVLRSRAEIEKRYVEQQMGLNKHWRMSAVSDSSKSNSGDVISNAVQELQKMNESISSKEKSLGNKLDSEWKKIDSEVKKLETFLRETQLVVKKLSVVKKKLGGKQQEQWKSWGNKVLDLIKLLNNKKKAKGELYGGILLIAESVEQHCQAQRELAAGVCQAWVGVNQLELSRIIVIKQAILNTKDAFKELYVEDSLQVDQALEQIDNEQLARRRMDINDVIGEIGRKIVDQQGGDVTMEGVFKYLEREWDGGWEEIAREFVMGKFKCRVMVVGKGKEIVSECIVTVENHLVVCEEGKLKPDVVFRLEMARCRVGEEGKAVELSEISSGIFSFQLKVILRFEDVEDAKIFQELINGCVQQV